MKLSPRDRRALVLCIVALGAIGAFWYGLLPWFERWSEARDRIEVARQQITDLEAQANRAIRQSQRLTDLYGPAAAKPLPALDVARSSFVKAVVDTTKTSGLAVRSVQLHGTQPLREVPGAVLMSFQVQATGSLQQVVSALAAMQKADMLILVERVNAGAGQDPSKLSVTLVLATLALQEDKA